ncbi:probable RNA polymerase II nuclear localization protein SLC7A6OS [Misgurnus anguillicaudatus]|uniref:probable RNA polymerase II nuclear localization protein SLC7A6OS n=1 Tax=Misgurnus anguillicaudatus TaxID=75329 RepID=UPI0024347CBE|nr:probable RNA polymerase II nuclear localization protein SLC7A6OS [Misgurnus anguillicaudatus]
MDPSTTILRVKRKRGTDPADALLLACKRIRPEAAVAAQPSDESEPEPQEPKIENSVFKLVATVASQDAPVQTHVREALARPRLAHHALRPSQGSAQRIIGDLRSVKWSTRREERYRILSSQRAGLPAEPAPVRGEEKDDSQTENHDGLPLGEVQVFDILHEDDDVKMPGKNVVSDPETILCNSVKMIREKLSVSGDRLGTEHREKEDDYVYDLYYQETTTPGWIQDILSVRPYTQEGELVPDVVAWEEEVYEDEDDENAESNWRNDYPDESSEGDSDAEERYGGFWSEEHSYSRRSWERYKQDMTEELENNSDEDEERERDSD